jgi:hypothetical protein
MDGGKTKNTLTFGMLKGRRGQDQNAGGFIVQKKSNTRCQ